MIMMRLLSNTLGIQGLAVRVDEAFAEGRALANLM